MHGLPAQSQQGAARQRPLAGRAHALDEMGRLQQAALLKPVEQLVHQRLDFHQHQRVELRQQPVHGGHAVGGRDDGHGVVLLGQRHARVRAGGREGVHAGQRLHGNARIQPAHGARQVAKGGVGAGVALHQKEHVAPGLQPGQHGLRGAQPGAGELFAVVRHGKQQRGGIRRRRQLRALKNAQRVAGRFGAAGRIHPGRVRALQLRPGRAGDQPRITGAE